MMEAQSRIHIHSCHVLICASPYPTLNPSQTSHTHPGNTQPKKRSGVKPKIMIQPIFGVGLVNPHLHNFLIHGRIF